MKPGRGKEQEPVVCPHCGRSLPEGTIPRRASGRNALVIGLTSLVVLLILGILDSGVMRDRLGLVEPTKEAEPVLESGNLIPNPSLEQPMGDNPLSWRGSAWGSNSARFEYLKSGYSSDRSIRVTVLSYEDGDAKWVHQPVTVTPGSDYQFTDVYQSNVTTNVVVELHKDDGATDYLGLPSAPESPEWKRYTATFAVPPGVSKIIVFHLLASDGYLITDDYGVRPHQVQGFKEGFLTLTFDDGWERNVESALPRLDRYGYKSVQFFATQYVEGVDESGGRKMIAEGHDIGAHSVTHSDLTKLDDEHLDFELERPKTFLTSITGSPVEYFAAPFGIYDTRVLEKIQEHGYRIHRTVDEGYNTKDGLDLMLLRVQNVRLDTKPEEFQAWMEKAQKDHCWLILVYHRIGGENLGQFDSREEDFERQLEIIHDSGIPVVTFGQALNEILPREGN